jgi:hypothetical protein
LLQESLTLGVELGENVRAQLGDTPFAVAWAEGRTVMLDDVLATRATVGPHSV